jgi:exonuclease SbcC
MIPIKLHLSGFLSYQDPVDLDFNGLSLACVSGSNGAGKSSLLDAITWALFGEARCRDDDALINSHVNAAEVIFDFEYENSLYRIQRSKPRGKTTVLEFYVLSPEGQWRTLTEKSVRETENRLRKILRLDYETFINASFFLQGRADQFAQQQPSNRKKVLTSVLGLEIWETYRASAVERRREVEAELRSVDAQMAEIDTELAQEEQRKKRLEEIEGRLGQLTGLRSAKESELASFQRLATSLAEQKRLLDVLSRRLQETRGRCQRLQEQVEGLKGERAVLLERLSHADEVEQVYQQWVADRDELERWNQVAASFHEVQARRAAPLAEIGAVQSRLEEERRGLSARADSAQLDSGRMAEIEHELPQLAAAIQAVQEHLAERAAMQAEQQTLQQQAAGLDVENRQLKSEMKALRERIDTLHEVEGGASTCPLCGQPLNPQEREVLVTGLEADGKRMGDAYRLNIFLQEQGKQRLLELQSLIVGMARLDDELRGHNRRHDQAEAELSRLRQSTEEWRAGGAKRLANLETVLAAGDYALEARARLAAVDGEARALGYDAAAHDAVRRSELAGRPAEQKLRELELARASLEPLERQITGLDEQLGSEETQRAVQESEFNLGDTALQANAAALPDLQKAEREVLAIQSDENRLRMEVGMVRQLVAVLDTQRERKARFTARRGELALTINRFKALERAFSKDGVPALLIEQALPEIEAQANDILDRLSQGGMSVRFATQRQLKSKDEMRETLDIMISDASGVREYEMFSGGEAFRVNFAIRLALSRVLAHRAGARLQTLFIDEGFGSQDADGRQRLLEAISLVQPEFARILVITHLEELKEAFPARIEVEKTLRGSRLRVVA